LRRPSKRQRRTDDGRVVSNFVVQALKGEPLTVYGDGSQVRSFCLVDDLIEGLVRLGTLESAPDAPISLGNEREVTIAEVADLVLAMTESPSGVERLPLPQDDLVRRRPDTARAREILEWEATVPLELGLPSTIEYFKSVL
jgi:nucleoside-diphosphate-sugar epimerase